MAAIPRKVYFKQEPLGDTSGHNRGERRGAAGTPPRRRPAYRGPRPRPRAAAAARCSGATRWSAGEATAGSRLQAGMGQRTTRREAIEEPPSSSSMRLQAPQIATGGPVRKRLIRSLPPALPGGSWLTSRQRGGGRSRQPTSQPHRCPAAGCAREGMDEGSAPTAAREIIHINNNIMTINNNNKAKRCYSLDKLLKMGFERGPARNKCTSTTPQATTGPC